MGGSCKPKIVNDLSKAYGWVSRAWGIVLETIAGSGRVSVVEKIIPQARAFTLAEVLIVLGIIGLIADMTIPTLHQKIENKVIITRLQKIYSVLSQAGLMAVTENGQVDSWALVDNNAAVTERVFNYYKPFLNISKECGNNPGCMPLPTKYLSGVVEYTIYPYNACWYTFILNDGTFVGLDVVPDYHGFVGLVLYVNLNGDKKPNQIGRDIFYFVQTIKGVMPYELENDETLCTKTGFGTDCAAKIFKEGAINY